MNVKFADAGDYIDIIIYAIALAAGLVASVYRNYNKQKGTQQKNPGGFPEFPLEPVFEYKEPQNDEPGEANLTEQANSSKSIEEQTSEQIVRNEEEYIEGEAVFESTRELIGYADRQITDQTISDDLTTKNFFEQPEETEEVYDFDIEKAVIYSEILKSKYF
jgi:hypothetical protein